MMTEESDKIVDTMKQICSREQNGEERFKLLVRIYNHISGHPNQPWDDRAKSLKDIIDSELDSGGPR